MTTLIGYRWKSSDVRSRVVLITRKLPKNFSSETECVLYKEIMFSFTWSIKRQVKQVVRDLERNVGGYSVKVHLFPFRTESLSFTAPMVLPLGGRVGRRQLHTTISLEA